MKLFLLLRDINWLGLSALLVAIGAFIFSPSGLTAALAAVTLAILSKD